jgi:hypothetical protein
VGWALQAEAGCQCYPHKSGLVRKPDGSFIRADGLVARLRENDERSVEEIIPGFRCRVRDVLPTREPRAEAPANPNGSAGDA